MQMTQNLQQLDILTASLSTINALLSNDNLFIEPYVSHYLPTTTPLSYFFLY